MMKWLNDFILFAFCRQSSDPEQLKRTVRETREFYKNYKKGRKK
jgi:hypothetical protein